MTATYQGWANHETWAVNLHIGNEQAGYVHWSAAAARHWDDAASDTEHPYWTRSECARFGLADELKAYFTDEAACPLLAEHNVYTDLLRSALDEVRWNDIADALLEQTEGYESSGRAL